jgi:hypothetical protein
MFADIVVLRQPGQRGPLECVKMSKKTFSISYALLQEPANLFAKRAVRGHAPVRLKLWPIGPAEWPILISHLDASVASVLNVANTQLRSAIRRDSFADALKLQDSLLDYEGILNVGSVGSVA